MRVPAYYIGEGLVGDDEAGADGRATAILPFAGDLVVAGYQKILR